MSKTLGWLAHHGQVAGLQAVPATAPLECGVRKCGLRTPPTRHCWKGPYAPRARIVKEAATVADRRCEHVEGEELRAFGFEVANDCLHARHRSRAKLCGRTRQFIYARGEINTAGVCDVGHKSLITGRTDHRSGQIPH